MIHSGIDSKVTNMQADETQNQCKTSADKLRLAARPSRRAGLSLLEVILALAILAMASAYLAQSMQLATTNALTAERLTQAELVAESVMNQVIAGVIPAQPVTWTAYYPPLQTTVVDSNQWMYQIQPVQTEMQGMVGLQVAVQEVSQTGLVRNDFDLYGNRWIIDPSLGLDVPPEEIVEESTSSGSSSSSSPTSGSSSTAPL